ncbi:MAG: hypothetical protein U0P81_05080 [Holophagaceae bacterium]
MPNAVRAPGAPRPSPWRRSGSAAALLALAFALAAGLALFLATQRRLSGVGAWSSFPLDDTWIHLHFARNLAEGHGFSSNPGVPVAGSTAPLWTLLLAAGHGLGGGPPFAKAAGIACALGTAGMAARLAALWTGRRLLGWTAGLAVALTGPMLWGALSGMEVSLAALLVTTALVLHTLRRPAAAATALGLAVLARPESILLLPLLLLAGPLTLRRALATALPPLLLLAPWILFNLKTGGSPLPVTASAKIEGGLVAFLRGAREPARTLLLDRPGEFLSAWVLWLSRANILLPPLALVGLGGLWLRPGRRAALPAALLLLHPLGMALLAPYRGPAFQEGRYSIHLLPLALVAALAGAHALGRLAVAAGWGRARVPLAAAALLLLAGIRELPGAAVRNGEAVQNISAMHESLGRWVADHTPPEARLALNDVGAIAYLSRREVVDLMGLVTPAILPYRREGEAGVIRFVEAVRPDYLIIFPGWFTLLPRTPGFRAVHRVRLVRNRVAGGDEMVVYETPWTRRAPSEGAAGR